MQLRPHQQRVLDVMLQHRIGQVIVPTGGGKTACMIFDAMRQDAGTIVIVAPRIILADSTLC
jgi:superfamily II DNA or RNA helicase